MDQLTRNIFHQDFGKHETKSKTVPRKRSAAQKSKCALRRTLKLSRSDFQISHSADWQFLDICDYKFIYFFAFCLTYDYSDIEIYPVPLHFFIMTSKILMSLSVLVLKIFSFKMSLLCYFSRKIVMFLFFTKNSYLLTTKINLDVYNCLQFLYVMQELSDSLCMLDAPFDV